MAPLTPMLTSVSLSVKSELVIAEWLRQALHNFKKRKLLMDNVLCMP